MHLQRSKENAMRKVGQTFLIFFFTWSFLAAVSGGAIKGPLPLKENDTRLSHRIKPDVRQSSAKMGLLNYEILAS